MINLIQRIDARDRSTSILNNIYSLLELIILNIILYAFIRDLNNYNIRKKATREIIFLDRSL